MIYWCKKNKVAFLLFQKLKKKNKNHESDYPSVKGHIERGSDVILQWQQTYISYMAVCVCGGGGGGEWRRMISFTRLLFSCQDQHTSCSCSLEFSAAKKGRL